MRHETHKHSLIHRALTLPTREKGSRIGPEDFPILATAMAGVASWVYPQVNAIDTFGLNDYVIARSPPVPGKRKMAHDRRAPRGYIASYRPNVWDWEVFHPTRVVARDPPMTAEEIAALELRWRRWLRDPH